MAADRLDKIIADGTAYSRREAGRLIREGKLMVDGVLCRRPEEKADPFLQEIRLAGALIRPLIGVTYMMNKPEGVLSATEDARERTVLDLIRPADRPKELFPAGRLDKDVSGLLILTDDGALCHRIISPRNKVFKTYEALVEGCPGEADIRLVAEGLLLPDGQLCLPGELRILKAGADSLCRLRICEGKFHQVKRMMAALGTPVLKLKRTAVGCLRLDETLAAGSYRPLDQSEIEAIFTPLPSDPASDPAD